MRAYEIILEDAAVTYAIYVDGKPAAKYQDMQSLKRDLSMMRSRFPNKIFTVEKETCKTTSLGSRFIG
jgi:hypothetical protein